jgi:antitoxin (DNA-binding transcriptional repressor) of toxin-antitoxin stability system
MMTMVTMTISEARSVLPALADRVRAGEEITLTQHGEPVLLLTRPDDELRRRNPEHWAAVDRFQKWMAEAGSEPFHPVEVPPGWADEMVADIRAGRDAR